MFNRGDKIICIDDSISPDKIELINSHFANWIKKDKNYIIRRVCDNDGIVTGLLLEEVYNKPIYFPLLNKVQEPAFAEWRFRKLNQNEKDESFEEKQMLTRKKEFHEHN